MALQNAIQLIYYVWFFLTKADKCKKSTYTQQDQDIEFNQLYCKKLKGESTLMMLIQFHFWCLMLCPLKFQAIWDDCLLGIISARNGVSYEGISYQDTGLGHTGPETYDSRQPDPGEDLQISCRSLPTQPALSSEESSQQI